LAVRIRLTRVGATKRPAYRVIAIDKRRSRDGRALEILGYYDPLTDPATVKLDTEKIDAWIGKGAQPSDTVVKLMKQASQPAPAAVEKPKRATRAKPKATKAAAAETAEVEAAPEAAKAAPADEAPATDVAEASAPEGASADEAAGDATASDEKADA
jgi:small subunit ribosomal protein S16